MSSTSNVQNYLSNVFRPYYVYDSNTGYQANLAISNVTSVTQETLVVDQLLIGDSNQNVYVGVNAGNNPALAADKACCNVTAVGYGAGNLISKVSNSVYVGTGAGSGAVLSDSVIAIGANTVGQGTSNIYIGKSTGPSSNGSGNIFIGNQMSVSGTVSDRLYIGRDSNYTITGNLATRQVGIGGATTFAQALDVSGSIYVSRNVGIGVTSPSRALDVSGDISASRLTIAKGTPGVPTYTFNTDGSSGMYLQGTSQVAFSTGGIQRMCISGANVAIAGDLTVQGDVSANGVTFNIGKLMTIDGSAAIPSHTFSNDASSGMYRPGLNQIGFSTIGVQRMCISGANVGIGTTAPSRTLDVSGDISGSRITVLNGTVAAPTHSFNADLSSGMYLQAASQLGFATGGVQRACISGTNVGIGTSAPVHALDVSGVSRTTGLLATYIRNALTPTTFDISGGNITYSGAISNSTAALSNVIGGVTLVNYGIDLSGAINSLNVASANSIGGVTLANYNIDMTGTITGYNANLSNTLGGVVLVNSNVRTGNGTAAAPTHTFNTDLSSGMYLQGTSQVGFATGGVRRIVISNANVGIGTTTPSRTLDVSGDISGSRITVLNGTVAAPTHSFNADLSSGMYLQAASQLGFATGGLQRLCISGANVGIGGITAPSRMLDVAGDISGSSITVLNGTVAAPTHSFNADLRSGMYLRDVSQLAFSTGGVERMCISGASVSIGTIVTGGTLDVSGNISAKRITVANGTIDAPGLAFNLDQTSGINSPSAGRINVVYNSNNLATFATEGVGIGIDTTTANVKLDVNGSIRARNAIRTSNGTVGAPTHTFHDDLSSGMYLRALNQLGFVTGGVERISVWNSNVGIGTIAPSRTLDVSGDISGGSITVLPGTVAAPSYAFNTDLSSGMFLQASNQIGVVTGGIQRLCISGGNVGIGNTTPEAALSFPRTAGDKISLYSNASGAYMGFGVRAAEFRTSADSVSTALTWGYYPGDLNSFVERMRLTSAGRLCIGTSASTYALDVSAANTNTFIVRNPTAQLASIRIVGGGNIDNSGVQLYQSSSEQALYINNASPFRIRMNGSDTFTILSNGNVGIATAAPAYTLDVSGTFAANTAEYVVYVTATQPSVTVPAGFTKAIVTACGGGGGGGGGSGTAGNGGGGGGGSGFIITQIITNPATFACTIGNGGAANGGGLPGSAGGNTTVTYSGSSGGTFIIAKGGSGGLAGIISGGSGGAGHYGGGGGGGGSTNFGAGPGGSGKIDDGSTGVPGSSGVAGAGGAGGGTGNAGSATTTFSGGGGGGGPTGGNGGNSGTGGGQGSLGGGGGGGGTGANGGSGGNGYVIFRFLR